MPDYIESTPDTRGGKPRIAGTRITVADIVLMHRRLGRALEEISGTYDLPLAATYAAMAFTRMRSTRAWTSKKAWLKCLETKTCRTYERKCMHSPAADDEKENG